MAAMNTNIPLVMISDDFCIEVAFFHCKAIKKLLTVDYANVMLMLSAKKSLPNGEAFFGVKAEIFNNQYFEG